MRKADLIVLGALAVAGVLAYKYRAKLLNLLHPDPTVTTLAGSTWGASQDVPGTVSSVTGTAPAGGTYDPYSQSPAENAALTATGAGFTYAGGANA